MHKLLKVCYVSSLIAYFLVPLSFWQSLRCLHIWRSDYLLKTIWVDFAKNRSYWKNTKGISGVYWIIASRWWNVSLCESFMCSMTYCFISSGIVPKAVRDLLWLQRILESSVPSLRSGESKCQQWGQSWHYAWWTHIWVTGISHSSIF